MTPGTKDSEGAAAGMDSRQSWHQRQLAPARVGAMASALVALAGPATVLLGLAVTPLLASLEPDRTVELAVLLGVAWLLAAIAAWATRLPVALGLMVLGVAALPVFADPLPFAATMLTALAALALGLAATASHRAELALPVGLALIAGAVGWLLPLPIHRSWLYAGLVLGLVAWQRRRLVACLKNSGGGLLQQTRSEPVASSIAALALLAASMACWLPTFAYDDLAYHLRLPWQLQLDGRYSLDPSHQIWALAPWGSDVVHALPQVLSGAESRGPVAALWIGLTATLLFRLTVALGGNHRLGWWVVALYASLPSTAAMAHGMQTEAPTLAVLLALALLVAAPHRIGDRHWLAIGALIGALATFKLWALLCAVALLPFALAEHWRAFTGRKVAITAAVAVLVGGSSYAYAAWVSGNPVLPAFNHVFGSAFAPHTQLQDPRWASGQWLSPWSITFDSIRFGELRAGGFGLLWLGLLSVVPLALLDRRSRWLTAGVVAMMLFGFWQLAYFRYSVPLAVLLLPALVIALQRALPRANKVLMLALVLGNLVLIPQGWWALRQPALRDTVRALGKDAPLWYDYAPTRLAAFAIRDSASPGPVLLLDDVEPFVAEFGTAGRTIGRYDFATSRSMDSVVSGADWAQLVHRSGAAQILVRRDRMTAEQSAALTMVGAELRGVFGNLEWWSIKAAAEGGQ